MANVIEITDFSAPELDVYARLTETQLLNRFEPAKGMFIAESPKVIERALNAGYVPVSFLMEPRHVETQARDILARCGEVPVYTAPLDKDTTLDEIYRRFNIEHPADYKGHSLSTGDIVVFRQDGKQTAYYVDEGADYRQVPEFFAQPEKQLTPDECMTGEQIQTPRGRFYLTDRSREQMEAAGYGFHHQSEDGRYLIMANGTRAFAIPAQPESHIKTAEMSTEQNYNMIDGMMNNADDLETTPATSLNDDPAVTKIGLDMAKHAFADAENAGLRVYHYGTTVNNPIGRAYFGLYNALSFLIETRGIGAGRQNFERRVFSQETAATSYIKYTAEHADEIVKTVAAARADVIAKGKTYDESDIIALYQTKSGKTLTDYTAATVQYSVADGSEKVSKASPLSLNDTLTRSRVRPTAYVIPADTANIEKILYIMDNQGAEYYKLNAGTTASLQQYYYIGEYMENDKAKGIEAGLRDAADVTFASGAYVFPMDQVAGNVIAMLCEPDVTDSNGYDGSLYQYKQIDYDKSTMNFPLYRYTGNDPRTTLVSNGTSAEPTQPTQPEKPSQPASSDTYTVVSGDSLWKIASKQLGNGNRWTEIYDLNKDTVKSPSVIFVGQILKMPLTAVSQ